MTDSKTFWRTVMTFFKLFYFFTFLLFFAFLFYFLSNHTYYHQKDALTDIMNKVIFMELVI